MTEGRQPTAPAGRTVHRDDRIELRLVPFPAREGPPIERAIVVHRGAVVLLPITDAGEIVLIDNLRHSIGQRLLELPAGSLEPGEDPALAAARELAEETGFEAAQIAPIGGFFSAPGFATEYLYAYRATGLRHVGQTLDAVEDIVVRPTAPDDVMALIAAGTIRDSKTLATLMLHLVGRHE